MKNIFIMQIIIFLLWLFCLFNPSLAFSNNSNLILNSTLETWSWWFPSNWSMGWWWKNISKFTYPTAGYNSISAAKITVAWYTNWDAKWSFDDVAVTSWETYTFSDMYNSDVDTSLTVRYKLSNWTYSYWYLWIAPKGTWWQNFTTDITVPLNVVSLTVFHVINKVWNLTIDDASLAVRVVVTPIIEVPLPNTDWNLVLNSTLEASSWSIPTNWSKGWWGTNISTYTYPTAWYNSTKSARIDVTSYTNWDAKWFFDEVPVTWGKNYTFSDMYSSNVDTSLTVRYKLTDWTYSYGYLGLATKNTWWEAFSVDITIPLNAVSLTVFHVINSVWFLSIDNASLIVKVVVVPAPNTDWNLVLNPSLETSNWSVPTNWLKGWWGTNVSKYTYPTTWYNTAKSAKIDVTSYTNWDSKWYFDDVAVSGGKTYTFTDMYNSDVNTTVTARYKLIDWTYSYAYVADVPKSTLWQKFSTSITVPLNAVSLTIFHVINSVWYLTIDDASVTLTKDDIFTEWMVTFTFDDGYKNVYDKAIPVLDKAGIKSTQAIVTNTYDFPDFMTKANIKALYDNWHEIASHTVSHAHLTLSWAREEIFQSKADLASYWVNASTFVYPYGEYDASTIALLKEAWYVWARSVEEWFNVPSSDKFQLKDLHIESNITWDTIKANIDIAISEKKWLILEMHEQGDNLWQYSNTVALLQQIVDYVKLKNVKTVTLGEWISKMN